MRDLILLKQTLLVTQNIVELLELKIEDPSFKFNKHSLKKLAIMLMQNDFADISSKYCSAYQGEYELYYYPGDCNLIIKFHGETIYNEKLVYLKTRYDSDKAYLSLLQKEIVQLEKQANQLEKFETLEKFAKQELEKLVKQMEELQYTLNAIQPEPIHPNYRENMPAFKVLNAVKHKIFEYKM